VNVRSMLALAMLALFGGGCGEHVIVNTDPSLTLHLRWVKGHPRETRADVESGLLWGLSYMGAKLPAGEHLVRWSGNVVTVDLARAELIAATLPAWRRFVSALKASDEYLRFGAIDIGRFMALTIGSSAHYYALTGASRTYAEFRAKYVFEPQQAAIAKSVIARGHRLVEIARAAQFGEIAFVAYEGAGSIADGSFEPREIETLDFMENGQLRFALYGLDGKLKHAATPQLTAAGKPAKCLWCHEINLHRAFDGTASIPGFYSSHQFDTIVAARNRIVAEHRKTLESLLDFERIYDHTFAELLYLSFMEPSAQRLAREWQLPFEQVRAHLRGRPTHVHHEHSFLGDKLYRREDVDVLAPFRVLQVPSDVREASAYEPDFVHDRDLAGAR
jgi:hypothetical protein